LDDGGAKHPYFTDDKGNPTSTPKTWNLDNAQQIFLGLSNINQALNGKLRTIIGSATFTLNTHPTSGYYQGRTSNLTIDFYVTTIMPLQNIYHEFGHLLNNVPGLKDKFTNAITNEGNPSWVDSDKKINVMALKSDTLTNDPNYPFNVQARQAFSNFGPGEQWADAFANYVAGNINLNSPQGADMNTFITGVLP